MTKDEIRDVIENALESKMKEFWVDRELHYKHHEFIDKWMQWADDTSKTVRHTVITFIILGLLGLLALGFFIRWKQ